WGDGPGTRIAWHGARPYLGSGRERSVVPAPTPPITERVRDRRRGGWWMRPSWCDKCRCWGAAGRHPVVTQSELHHLRGRRAGDHATGPPGRVRETRDDVRGGVGRRHADEGGHLAGHVVAVLHLLSGAGLAGHPVAGNRRTESGGARHGNHGLQ